MRGWRRWRRSVPAEEVQLLYQIALTGRRDLAMSPDAEAAFEMTLLRMLAFRPARYRRWRRQLRRAARRPRVRRRQCQRLLPYRKRLPPARVIAAAQRGRVGTGHSDADGGNSAAPFEHCVHRNTSPHRNRVGFGSAS